MSRGTGALGRKRSVFLIVFVSLHMFVCTQGKETMCVFVSEGCKEGVSQPAWAYSVSPPTLTAFLLTSHLVSLSLPLLLTHSFHLSIHPPSKRHTKHTRNTHTHTTHCLSFSDSSSRGPGACWWRLHRSFPSCGGGCTHMHTHAHANTRVHTHTQAS